METTPGTPHLLTDVRFSVSRKGYDPDEVDNFLERVSAAVAQLQDKLRQATASAFATKAVFRLELLNLNQALALRRQRLLLRFVRSTRQSTPNKRRRCL